MAANFDRFYQDAVDKNVAAVKVYADSNKALFYDAEFTEEKAVPAEDALNLFVKGVVALYDGSWYAAKSCSEEGVIDFGFPAG